MVLVYAKLKPSYRLGGVSQDLRLGSIAGGTAWGVGIAADALCRSPSSLACLVHFPELSSWCQLEASRCGLFGSPKLVFRQLSTLSEARLPVSNGERVSASRRIACIGSRDCPVAENEAVEHLDTVATLLLASPR